MMNLFRYNQQNKFKGKSVSLVLVLFLLFNVSGYYIWFNIAQDKIRKEIRSQIKAGLKDESLTIIRITEEIAPEIKWIRAKEEFTFRGEMYDVVKMEDRDGSKLIYCLNDVKEKKLIADFARKNDSNQKTRKLLSYFTYNFVFQPVILNNIREISDLNFCIPVFDIKSKIKEVAVPPPKSLFFS
jgi:hypothetical protein